MYSLWRRCSFWFFVTLVVLSFSFLLFCFKFLCLPQSHRISTYCQLEHCVIVWVDSISALLVRSVNGSNCHLQLTIPLPKKTLVQRTPIVQASVIARVEPSIVPIENSKKFLWIYPKRPKDCFWTITRSLPFRLLDCSIGCLIYWVLIWVGTRFLVLKKELLRGPIVSSKCKWPNLTQN